MYIHRAGSLANACLSTRTYVCIHRRKRTEAPSLLDDENMERRREGAKERREKERERAREKERERERGRKGEREREIESLRRLMGIGEPL